MRFEPTRYFVYIMDKERIKKFFNLLDCYLIGDLDTMVFEIPPRPSGGLCYPAMQTILSGMELLGILLSGGMKESAAYNYFWDNFFTQDNRRYAATIYKLIFRQSVRNGIAHYFLTKSGIRISKVGKYNLTKTENNELIIDVVTFYRDFKKTYLRIKNDLLNGTAKKEIYDKFEVGYSVLIRDLKCYSTAIDEYFTEMNNSAKFILRHPELSGSLQFLDNITRIPDEILNREATSKHD